MEAVLLTSGELGFQSATVGATARRYGGDPAQFYRHFDGLGDGFAAAYDWQVERISNEALAAAAAAGDWRDGLQDALEVFAAFVEARPLTARALLVEVHVAGEAAMAARRRAFERLTRAIDSARRADPPHPPPPTTGLFMVGAIEGSMISALASGRPSAFAAAIPGLSRLVAAAYLGEESAF
jgi:AcrR family transcriptional regulator